ncbi:MAG: phenylalanine--tRNA ligase subunit alpha [Nanoarchaeota archaeon]
MPEHKALDNVIDSLSPLEIKIIPFLNKDIKTIQERTQLDETSIIRALHFLENKNMVVVHTTKRRTINLGTNGIYYRKNHLPERNLLTLLEKQSPISIEEAKKLSKLSDNEFKVSLGVLKNKALIIIKNEKIQLNASKEEIIKKTLEEKFLENLPLDEDSLTSEQKYALEKLKGRKDIIEIKEKSEISFELTNLGKEIAGKEIKSDLIEELTPEIISSWTKNKRFRKYDLYSDVPRIYGGRKHFVNEGIKKARRIWLDMGFAEMTESKTVSSFWNFDALFTAQDHPVRDLHDTFFIKNTYSELPEKSIVLKVKEAHEKGVGKSKGWSYKWDEKEARKIVLRTHTTCLSAKKLSTIKKNELPAKFFAIGKCFRNETLDWSHGFEFNQSEGIIIDKNANFMHLLGCLKEFFRKMGFEKIRFTPSYFPYTEPSLEVSVWHPEKNIWLELGGAGIFRPEVVIPLLGENIPVLAWGPGFDRMLMDHYQIKDLREMYENDINKLRKIKI